jgi:DNA-binding CsgD family transcriptional regulator
LDELSAVLLALYAAAREAPLCAFQDTALALIAPLVAFTSAAWGSGRILADGLKHHSVHLLGDPPDRLMDYEEVKHLDTAAFTVGQNPGRAFAFHAPSLYRERKFAGIREYATRWEHENYVLASHHDTEAGLLHWIGIYRPDTCSQYSEAERKTIELLFPHLMESLTINRVIQLERPSEPAPRGTAITDRFCVLHHADQRFVELMAQEWPRTAGRQVPPALLQELGGSSGDHYRGRRIVVTARPASDLLILTARQKLPVDELTPRELAVARHVAQGLHHKEIAERLGLSPATVRNYTQAIHDRLGVHSNVELAAKLKAAGL